MGRQTDLFLGTVRCPGGSLMDSGVGTKKTEFGKSEASETSGKSKKSEIPREPQKVTQELIREVADAMHRWYWSRKNNLTRDDAVRPALDVLEYAYKARKEGLDRKSETAYCGSILLYSVMSLTGRRHTSDVDEANELYEAGRKLASAIWDEFDSHEGMDKADKRVKDPDGLDSFYTDISGRISDGLWNEYQKMKGAGRAENKKSRSKGSGEPGRTRRRD